MRPYKRNNHMWPLSLLPLLLTACGTAPPSLPVAAPAIPPLPQQARQPQPPASCLPTCNAGLTRLRENLLSTPTPPTPPAAPASGPTTR